jgi:hypothetical protein
LDGAARTKQCGAALAGEILPGVNRVRYSPTNFARLYCLTKGVIFLRYKPISNT